VSAWPMVRRERQARRRRANSPSNIAKLRVTRIARRANLGEPRPNGAAMSYEQPSPAPRRASRWLESPPSSSAACVGLIVVVRTFLCFSLEAELDGQWPWQKRRGARPADHRRPAAGQDDQG
jgi:hypothetical protein